MAESAARAAGEAVMRHYGRASHREKDDASPVTEADHAANAVILERLGDAFPQDAILSEESRDRRDRLAARRVWIVDPLDGTREFLARNGEFAIMIGLVEGGVPAVGVVYRPADDVLHSAVRGQGAWMERAGERARLRAPAADPSSLRMIGSRSHPDAVVRRIREELGVAAVEPCGSVGVKCGRIAEGRSDLYIHPVPYLREWDTCAPELVLREAGGHVSDCFGGPLTYNKPEPRQPRGLLACAPGIAGMVLERIGPLVRERPGGTAE